MSISYKIVSGRNPEPRGSQGLPGDPPNIGPQGSPPQGQEGDQGTPGPTCDCRLDTHIDEVRATGPPNPNDFLLYDSTTNPQNPTWNKTTPQANQFPIDEINFSQIPTFADLDSLTIGYKKLFHLTTNPEQIHLTYRYSVYNNIPDLQAHWLLNETIGPTIKEHVSNKNGTTFNNPTFGAVGPNDTFPTAMSFNASNQDWINVPFDPIFNPSPPDFSVSLWAKANSAGAGTYRRVVGMNRSLEGSLWGWILYCTPDNKWEFWTARHSGGWDTFTSEPSISHNVWTHLVVTWQTTSGPDGNGNYTGNKTLYHNTTKITNNSRLYRPNSTNDFGIAHVEQTVTSEFFYGEIADVRFFNRTLTQTEVNTIYNTP